MGVYRMPVKIILADGSRESVPVEMPDSLAEAVVAKSEREGIPLHLLIADLCWHMVAQAKGTPDGWSMPPVDGHTLPLPRANGKQVQSWQEALR